MKRNLCNGLVLLLEKSVCLKALEVEKEVLEVRGE